MLEKTIQQLTDNIGSDETIMFLPCPLGLQFVRTRKVNGKLLNITRIISLRQLTSAKFDLLGDELEQTALQIRAAE